MNKPLTDFFAYPEFEMRPLTKNDIPETVTLLNNAFRYQEEATGHKRTSHEHLLNYMTTLNCFVITKENLIIGTVAYEDKAPILHFGLVSVSEDYRGSGLAKAIMKSIEDFANSNHYKLLELDFMSIAPWLEKYYGKFGFKKTGHTERWKDTDLIQMQKKIIKP